MRFKDFQLIKGIFPRNVLYSNKRLTDYFIKKLNLFIIIYFLTRGYYYPHSVLSKNYFGRVDTNIFLKMFLLKKKYFFNI